MLSSFHDLDNKFDRVVHIFFEVVFLIFYGFVIQNPVLFKIKFCFFFLSGYLIHMIMLVSFGGLT
jgi:hypothetical protein